MTSDTPPASPPTRLKIPLVVLALSLLITLAATYYVSRSADQKDRARFDRWAEQTQTQIKERLDTYVTLLNGGAGLFASTDKVTLGEFRTYVQRLRLGEHYPGIQGIGFSARESAIGHDLLERAMRAQGVTDFAIRPRDPPRSEYHAIIYLEPLDARNRAAIGYDMFSEPTRRAAMERARDTGMPAATGKVTLIQEIDATERQAGFLIYSPVYYTPVVPEAVEQRRKALLGFVYTPFRADDLLDAISGAHPKHGLVLHVYDGHNTTPEALLHRSDRARPLPADYRARFESKSNIDVEGRPWTLVYRDGPAFEHSSERGGPTVLILCGGIAASLLLSGLSLAQATARSRAEHAASNLRISESALRVSESKFRRLAESNLVGVAFADTRGHILDGNDAFFGMIGRTRGQALGGKLRWDEITPSEWRDADTKCVAELDRHGTCKPFEKEFIRPDGSRVAVLLGVALLEGSTTDAVAVCVDLSDRKRSEAQLRAARDEAEAANRLKDEFLATVSHELRTPLNAILGWAQILRAADAAPDEVAHGLDTIERNAKAQAQLIGDLLDVSRIVSGKFRLDVKTVDLMSVVEAALEACRPAADAKGLRINRVLDPSAGPVAGDPDRLQQVVWNLLSNAVKFTPRGGRVEVLLRRSGAPDDAHAEVVVSDTGTGIGPQFLPHVFDRFRQADATTTRRHGGLGLGLAIVRHIVELHGGSVHAHSEGENRGATFVVSLPLTLAKAAAVAPPSAVTDDQLDPGKRCPPISLAGVRVLVVDDEPDSRYLIAKILRDCEAEVSVASSAAEAIEQFAQARPQVLVSDIGMPEEDGYALLKRIRAMEPSGNGGVNAIALTALARGEDRRRALVEGFQLHLPKPVEPGELRAAVANLVGRAPSSA